MSLIYSYLIEFPAAEHGNVVKLRALVPSGRAPVDVYVSIVGFVVHAPRRAHEI